MFFHPQGDLPGSCLHCKSFSKKSSNITAAYDCSKTPLAGFPLVGATTMARVWEGAIKRQEIKAKGSVALLALGLSFKGPITSQHPFPAGQVLTCLRTLGRVLNYIQTTFESPTVVFHCLQLDPLHNNSGQWTGPVTRNCHVFHGWTWATNLPCLWDC